MTSTREPAYPPQSPQSRRPLAGTTVLALTPVGAYGGFNTSAHRISALRELGCVVTVLDAAGGGNGGWGASSRVRHYLYRLGLSVSLPDPLDDERRVVAEATHGHWDVIWLEKSLTISARCIGRIRRACPRALIVGFSADDMSARHNTSAQFMDAIPHYDWFVTTKSYNVGELAALGCKHPLFVGNGYDPASFRPVNASQEDILRLGGDVGFIGTYEAERAASMLYLANEGHKVRVWGDGWEKMKSKHDNLRIEYRSLQGDDLARACGAFKINLAFLRKLNRDLQTTRSVEIPACGGFMLAERTVEHLELFSEGQEAEFFGSDEELNYKCRKYLASEQNRVTIATAGRARCERSGYSNSARLLGALRTIFATVEKTNSREAQ